MTSREKRIARLVAQGCSDQVISRRVNMTPEAVRAELVRIFKKLAVAGLLDRLLYVGQTRKRLC